MYVAAVQHTKPPEARPLDARVAITDNSPQMPAENGAGERLRLELEDVHASRARLVAAADAERREFERKLHDGVQQDLVAVIVNLQLARELCRKGDPAAAGGLLEEIGRDVRVALDGLRRVAFEIYPPLLDAGGLVVALRSVAAEEGIAIHVEAEALPSGQPELAAAVYFCCREALRIAALHAGTARACVRVHEAAVDFEVTDDGYAFTEDRTREGLRRVTDRVDALGGRWEIDSEPGRGTRVFGSLPLT